MSLAPAGPSRPWSCLLGNGIGSHSANDDDCSANRRLRLHTLLFAHLRHDSTTASDSTGTVLDGEKKIRNKKK